MTILHPGASANGFLTANPRDKGVLLVYAGLPYVCACLTENSAFDKRSKKLNKKKTAEPNKLKLAQNMSKTLGYMPIKFR